ncbi:MAG: prepilin-type N-terminal cleavage/methylation domain-containing protein [Candidatus Riflebacteria bacterium]
MSLLTKNRSEGFTLVEVAVSALIFAVMAAVIITFWSRFNVNVGPKISNRLFLQMEGRSLADNLAHEIRSCSDIVRPRTGESTPFLLVKDARNQIKFFYLSFDLQASKISQKQLYQLISFTYGYKNDRNKTMVIGKNISRISFSGISANSVQCNILIENEKNRFQFLTHLGVMSFGDSDV